MKNVLILKMITKEVSCTCLNAVSERHRFYTKHAQNVLKILVGPATQNQIQLRPVPDLSDLTNPLLKIFCQSFCENMKESVLEFTDTFIVWNEVLRDEVLPFVGMV